MAKNCKSPTSAWAEQCATWETDRLGYRQLRNRQLSEHEFSAFGAVRAEQIEGILVIRKPAAVP